MTELRAKQHVTLRYAGTLARTPRPTVPHWSRVPRRTASPANGREAQWGGGGPTPGPRFPPSPPPPAEARPGLDGGRAGLINQGLVVDTGGGDATQGGKPATEEAGTGLVLLPRALLTDTRLPPRRENGGGRLELVRGGGRTPTAGVGARHRAVPAVGGRRAAQVVYEHRCPRALGRWQLGALSQRQAERGAPRNPPHPPRAPAPAPGRGLFPGRHQSHSLVRFPGSGSRLFWM